ncbi:MAG: MoxR family ATPase, partial [Ignavibacteriae bacterium]|nr:MoxR family ATPase [Ignavibacteriota bacterium]
YPLPEAQVDRFMLKVKITYPTREEELKILHRNVGSKPSEIKPVITIDSILNARKLVHDIYVDEKIEKYILDIVFATRNPKHFGLDNLTDLISNGASPRATINLALAARASAFIKRRGYVVPEDVRALCMDVLRHRIGITYEAEAEEITSENIIEQILNKVEVP